jgi:polyisoprenoid-binding protein YceI
VGIWNVDPVHSTANFAVKYMIGTFRGSFSPATVRLEVGEDGKAVLTGSVPVKGVKVQQPDLEAHLQSPEFFDAERTPEVSFNASDIRREGDAVEVDGELTIRGITHPVTATGTITDPADDPYGGVRFGLVLETVIDRTKFGLTWNNPLPSGKPALSNDVAINADLYLVKE